MTSGSTPANFSRMLTAKRGRVTHTSRSQTGSPPCQSFFASPIRLVHRCPVTRTVLTIAMNIHGIESTTLHFLKDPRSKQADLRDSIMSQSRPSSISMMTSMTISSNTCLRACDGSSSKRYTRRAQEAEAGTKAGKSSDEKLDIAISMFDLSPCAVYRRTKHKKCIISPAVSVKDRAVP